MDTRAAVERREAPLPSVNGERERLASVPAGRLPVKGPRKPLAPPGAPFPF
jgi:hypothetical protein